MCATSWYGLKRSLFFASHLFYSAIFILFFNHCGFANQSRYALRACVLGAARTAELLHLRRRFAPSKWRSLAERT